MRHRFVLALGLALVLARPMAAQPIGPNQTITVVDSGTACVTAPAACATYALDNNSPGVTINIAGTWTGTLTFEGTNNDGNWVALGLTTNVATGAQASTTTASGLFAITNTGVIKVRVRATAAITGAALVTAARGSGFARAGPAMGPGGTTTSQGPFLAPNGTSAAPSYSFTASPDLGFYRPNAFTVAGAGAGVPSLALVIGAAGSVVQNNAAKFGWTNTADAVSGTADTLMGRGGIGEITYTTVLFSALGTPAVGTVALCTDCAPTTPATCPATKASCICTSGGVGSVAYRFNSVWYCPF